MQRFTVEDGRAGLDMKRRRAHGSGDPQACRQKARPQETDAPLALHWRRSSCDDGSSDDRSSIGTAPDAVRIRNAEVEQHAEESVGADRNWLGAPVRGQLEAALRAERAAFKPAWLALTDLTAGRPAIRLDQISVCSAISRASSTSIEGPQGPSCADAPHRVVPYPVGSRSSFSSGVG